MKHKDTSGTPLKNTLIYILTTILIFSIIFLALLLISNQQQLQNSLAPTPPAISIIDGDTFQTLDGEIVRLLCVNTPERDAEGFEDARAYLSSLIIGKEISIERGGVDKYNRTLAWVYVDSFLVNKEIVDNGFGEIFEYEGTDCGLMG